MICRCGIWNTNRYLLSIISESVICVERQVTSSHQQEMVYMYTSSTTAPVGPPTDRWVIMRRDQNRGGRYLRAGLGVGRRALTTGLGQCNRPRLWAEARDLLLLASWPC